MAFELGVLCALAVLQMTLISVHSISIAFSAGIKWGIGRRDTQGQHSDFSRRAERSMINTMESLFVFIPLVLIVMISGVQDQLIRTAALVFIAARVCFAAIYLLNIPYLRTVSWFAAIASLLVMIIKIAFFILPNLS